MNSKKSLRRAMWAICVACLAMCAGMAAHAQTQEEMRSYAPSGDGRAQQSGFDGESVDPDIARYGAGSASAGQLSEAQGAGLAGMRLDHSFNSLSQRPAQDAESQPGGRWDVGAGQRRSMALRKPSRFQQFVQETTGRLLPLYGQELFDPPQVAYVPDANAPAPDDYVLGPGDEVRVRVWGTVNYEGNLTLDRNGQINIPRAGVVSLAGVRVKDVENAIRSQVGKTFTNFRLSSNPGRLSSIQIYVVGQAEQPGSFTVSSLSTLVNALFVAGGPNVNGSMRNIQLRRGAQIVATLDLYDFIGQGGSDNDVPLLPGDVIVIPPAGPRVAVGGALDNAAVYELKPGEGSRTTLGEILNLTGGVPTLARAQKALLERVAVDGQTSRQVEDIALDQAGLNTPLRDGDIVTLLDISPEFTNAVTLQGNVATPARYRWFEGMRIRDLIPDRDALIVPEYFHRKNRLVRLPAADEQSLAAVRRRQSPRGIEPDDVASDTGAVPRPQPQPGTDAMSSPASQPYRQNSNKREGSTPPDPRIPPNSPPLAQRLRSMVDQINWDYAVIERLDREHLRTTLIPFNLGRAVLQADESQNLPLQPGDVVTILNQKDLKLPQDRQTRLVQVEGEIAAPGVYETRPGETLRDLLTRIGGLTPQAYLFGTEIQRVSVREKQQQNLDMLIRRLEQQQQSQILFILANRNSGDPGSQAALIQQQQQLARTQLEALRKLRSSGRISLELDPQASGIDALPELSLEDGDRIFVPSTPGFVNAVGAVNNENVFIYRQGRTVGDVSKVAGLREEADVREMFVLRADGSIVSRRDRRSWFGSGFDRMQLMPGDTLVIPEELDRETTRNFVTRQLKDWTQIISQFGLGLAAIKVIRDL